MDLILLASGVGNRTQLSYPKQFLKLKSKPILIWILELFDKIEIIDKIIITTIPNQSLDLNYCAKVICVEGGKTRQQSVYNALQYCNSDRVIIHESARPFITYEHILELVSKSGDVVTPYLPLSPTLYHSDGYYLNRSKVCNIQLPQVFNTNILKEAHELAKTNDNVYTDDSSLVFSEMNIRPTLINGLESNIKITTPLDIKLAEMMVNENYSNWWK